MNIQELKARARQVLEEKGMSASEAADMIGISRSTMSRALSEKTGNVGEATLLKIMEMVGVSVSRCVVYEMN